MSDSAFTGAETPRCAQRLDKIAGGMDFAKRLAYYLNFVALAVLFLMVLCTFLDVFMRYVVKNAIVGMKEYTEVMLFALVGMCVAHTFSEGKHITVTLVLDMLKPKAHAVMGIISTLITTVFLGFLTYSSIDLSILYIQQHKAHGAIMQIPMWPMMILVTIGFLLSFILSLRSVFVALANASRARVPVYAAVLALLVGTAVLVVLGLVMTKVLVFSKGFLCLAAVIVMFLLMFSGVPIGYTLWIIGTVLIGNMRGFAAAMAQLATLNLQTTTDYSWSVVAFFLLMGFLAFHARFGEDIFRCIQMFLSRVSGGLCVVTIAASACLAAVVGDNNAVVSTMSSIAYPEMKRLKYNDRLAMGTLAAGSCLGPLIPPSTGFITYSLLTMVSLGKLFASGIIPGIMLALAFIITIIIICKRHPEYGPKGEKHTRQEKLRSLPGALPILILFVFVIGGTMAGIFTATEAGAMGCVGAMIIAAVMGRFKFKTILGAFDSSGSMIGMIFTVIVGAKVFSSGLSWCNLSSIVSGFFNSLNWSPKLTVAFILLCFFIAGFFIDLLPLMFVGIPIVFSVISALGIDGVWFGCLLVMICNTGVITPPFATVLFVMKGLMPEVPMKDIFKGVIPFVIATVIVVAILFFIPDLVLLIPNGIAAK